MDPHAKKYERGSNWSEPEVAELLQLWSDEAVQSELVSCLRNQHVFNRIAAALQARGVFRTGDQCREKIKKLKLEYRRIKVNKKSLRGGRAWKFYDILDGVLGNRTFSSSSYAAGAWSSSGINSGSPVPLLPADSTPSPATDYTHRLTGAAFRADALLLSRPTNTEQLMEVKREDTNTDDELLGSEPQPPELLYQIGSEDEEEEGEEEGDCKPVGGEPDFGEMERDGGGVHAGRSPTGFSDHINAGSSGLHVSPTAPPLLLKESRLQHDEEEPRHSRSFRPKRRRWAGRVGGSGRLLENALASFLSLQRELEERYLSLEEARLQQEAQAEERRERQEERRMQQDREHELRLLSLLSGALAAVKGTPEQDKAGTSGRGTDSDPVTSASASESPSFSVSLTSPLSAQRPSPAPFCLPGAGSVLSGSPKTQQSGCLSRRGNSILQHQGILQEGFTLYHANKHHEDTNPDGIINLGTSENKLCFDLLQKRLSQPDMLHVEPALLQYPDWKGHGFLREEVAKFLSEHCHSPERLLAENVVVMNGCGSVFCAVAAVLCDPDDAILIPSPFYGVIMEDVYLYGGVKLYCVPLDSEPTENNSRPFHLTAAKLEHALQRAKKEGVNVRAVILVNPHNPLGEIYTPEEMISFLQFAKKHELHAIVDEIYMLSVFGEDDSFHSVLSLGRLPDPQRTHVLWGISKDFAMAGMRLGTVYSENKELVQALDKLGCFHGVAGPTQHQVAQLLRDQEWMNGVFLLENRRRLQEAHRYVSSQLKSLGIPYLHRGAGFFIWADFSKYLNELTFKEELRVWRCFLKHRVLLSCGQAFSCSSPGWFRIVFSDQRQRLERGLERIGETLEELQCSSMRPACENTNTDKLEGCRQAGVTTETTQNKNSDKNITTKACSLSTKLLCDGNKTEIKNLSVDDEDIVVFSCPSPKSENLDSLIGALRQQIQSSDWLEKNRPVLADGEDPTQVDVFKDLLDRARM